MSLMTEVINVLTPELTELLMSLMEGGRAVPGAWSASLRSETVPEM